jgi:hypothetical protein
MGGATFRRRSWSRFGCQWSLWADDGNPEVVMLALGRYIGETTVCRDRMPRECKPFCVNPIAFWPRHNRNSGIHIRKSLNAGTSEGATEPLVRDQVFTFSTV